MEPVTHLLDRSHARPRGLQSQDGAGHGDHDSGGRSCRPRYCWRTSRARPADSSSIAASRTRFLEFPSWRRWWWAWSGWWTRSGSAAAGARKLPDAACAPLGMVISVCLHRGALPHSAGLYKQLWRPAVLSLLSPVVCLGHCFHHRAADACGADCGAGAAVAFWTGGTGDRRAPTRPARARRGDCGIAFYCGAVGSAGLRAPACAGGSERDRVPGRGCHPRCRLSVHGEPIPVGRSCRNLQGLHLDAGRFARPGGRSRQPRSELLQTGADGGDRGGAQDGAGPRLHRVGAISAGGSRTS